MLCYTKNTLFVNIFSKMKVSVAVLLSVIAVTYSANTKNNLPKQWALLTTGYNGWENYGQTANVAHAYHLLIGRGIPASNIIVMMYDDIAYNKQNPKPGIVINRPDGPDVYKGIKIDYKGEDLTPDNFLAVLTGNKTAMKGKGTERVIESGATDNVFVLFSDHGGGHMLIFPENVLHASDFNKALKMMHVQKQYGKMLLYIDACFSGSMFQGLLPNNIKILSRTCAAYDEFGYMCYCDYKHYPCLSTLSSAKWLEDMDKQRPAQENIFDQFQRNRLLTNSSHVNLYGDYNVGPSLITEFLGAHNIKQEQESSEDPSIYEEKEKVPILDGALYYFKRMAKEGRNEMEKAVYAQKAADVEKKRELVDSIFAKIVEAFASNDEGLIDIISNERQLLPEEKHECFKNVFNNFNKKCLNTSKNPYVARHFFKFANMCYMGVEYQEIAITAINSVCHDDFPVITGAL